jgi:hypothetical protein
VRSVSLLLKVQQCRKESLRCVYKEDLYKEGCISMAIQAAESGGMVADTPAMAARLKEMHPAPAGGFDYDFSRELLGSIIIRLRRSNQMQSRAQLTATKAPLEAQSTKPKGCGADTRKRPDALDRCHWQWAPPSH